MKNSLYPVYLFLTVVLLVGCEGKIKLTGNFFDIQLDSLNTHQKLSRLDNFGFDSLPLIKSVYVSDDIVNIYFWKKATESYNISSKEADKGGILYVLTNPQNNNGSRAFLGFNNDSTLYIDVNGFKRWYKVYSTKTVAEAPTVNDVPFLQIENYENNQNIRGNVNHVHTKKYKVEERYGEYVLGLIGEEVVEYNQSGKIINRAIFDYVCEFGTYEIKRTLQNKYRFEYNGNLLVLSEKQYLGRFPKNFKTTYRYNENNKLISECEEQKDISYNSTYTTQTDYINLMDSTSIGYKPTNRTVIYKKGDNGSIIGTTYEVGGKELWTSYYDKNWFLISGYKKYENLGEMKTSVQYLHDNILIEKEYAGHIGWEEGLMTNKVNLVYDKNGDVLSEAIEYIDKRSSRYGTDKKTFYVYEQKNYAYIFDINGNWIKRKINSEVNDPDGYGFEQPKIIIEEREIEYYH